MKRALVVLGGVMIAALAPGGAARAERGPVTPTILPDVLAKAPAIDGLLTDWTTLSTTLTALKGAPRTSDLSATARIGVDEKNLYVAVDVTDDVFKGGLDRVDLVVGSPDRSTQTISLFPGEVGKAARATKGDKKIDGAKVVEAPKKGGYTLEAKIPWSAISTARVGLRGAIVVHDADGAEVDAAVASAKKLDWADLPGLPFQLEQGALKNAFKTSSGGVAIDMVGNVAGDADPERVMFDDKNGLLVVLGSGIRSGKEFYFADLKRQGVKVEIGRAELRDFDGDGKKDIYFERRTTEQKVTRVVGTVYSFKTDTPDTLFQHEIGIETSAGSIKNRVSFSAEKDKTVITITPGEAQKLDATSYKEPTETSFDPVLLPWGPVSEQVYKVSGGKLAKASEKRNESAASTTPSAPAGEGTKKPVQGTAPSPPPMPSTEQIYDRYKKDQKASGKAKVDVTSDVDGDGRTERVIVHGRDIVVMGPGFKSGTGYAFATLPFADPADVKTVALKDVTGDKKADLVIRGVVRGKAPKEAGGGDVERELELVYRVTGETVKRVFGAEVGRALGQKRVEGRISYRDKDNKLSIVLSAGKASGFTKESYPFNQDTSQVGGMEPLILPWSGIDPVAYKWNGTAFAR
jgi:hypothetical protein